VPRSRKLAVAAFAFSGMAALIYEVIWTRELSLVFGSTVYAVSMMLTAFMSGLSLGSFMGGKWADRSKNLIALFGRLELGIAVFGLLTIPLIQVLPTLYFFVYNTIKPSFVLFFFFQLLLSFVIMLIPTTFMGATFPVVTKINATSLEELGLDVGNVYSINTVGSIVGSLGSGFMLIPLIGIKGTTFVAAGLNLFVAASMIVVSNSRQRG
jgi:spermidine synthase